MLLRYAVKLSGITSLALTKLDVLSGFKKIKICVRYRINNKTYDYLPFDVWNVQPVYETLPGWDELEARLSEGALEFIKSVEKVSGAKVGIVSTGPERNATIAL